MNKRKIDFTLIYTGNKIVAATLDFEGKSAAVVENKNAKGRLSNAEFKVLLEQLKLVNHI